MSISEDCFLVIDEGRVVYQSTDRQMADQVMGMRRRGVLVQVLKVCVTDFIAFEQPKTPKPRKRSKKAS